MNWTLMYAIKNFLTCVSGDFLSIEELMLGNEFHLMCITSVLWKHRRKNKLKVMYKEKHLFWDVIYFVGVCEREKESRIGNY